MNPKPAIFRPASGLAGLILLAAVTGAAGACAPTVRVEVAPIQIYAKLDADVRVRLDRELQQLLQENPNLF
ncbi:MAG: YnbE family lipoprotein [Brevundimonas sp.]|uniref:YnbE family lipoprotein n=1 Tax=Brevundimonas sp. TaxID=1871086 RepID=UPI0025C1907D|nr:YnbE family lipoprotein [Brevundimonas sp.]MBX3478003.1 YnbE family lipoprotein [Brevundimonas sp.]